jgi:CBS domain-containing protein
MRAVRQDPLLVDVRKSPDDAATIMKRRSMDYAVVHDRGLIVGVLSRKDLDRELGGRAREKSLRRLAKYKGTIRADTSLDEAARVLQRRNARAIPVLEGNRVVGIVRPADQ